MHLHIFGRGKMALMIGQKCLEIGLPHEISQELPLHSNQDHKNTVVVHVGSGQYLSQLIAECERHGYTLVQASSGQKLPEVVKTPIIDAPNLALPIVALFDVLPRFGDLMQRVGGTAEVMESHQASKTSAPITAQKIAGYFGNPPESVQSIRDLLIQRESLHVPEEHLGGHAYHFVRANAHGVGIELSFKVHGRDVYFNGLLAVANRIIELGEKLEPRVHSVNELLFT